MEYESIEDEDFDPDLESRVNAALQAGAAKSGIPWQSPTDVEKRETAAYGHAMAEVASIQLCGIVDKNGDYAVLRAYDTCIQINPANEESVPQGSMIVQMLAAARLQRWHEECQIADERLINTAKAASYDEADPLTATRLYVLTERSQRIVPLEIPFDWKRYVQDVLGSQFKCEVHLLHRCYDRQAAPALKILVYNRAEIVFAWKICDQCLDAMSWINYGDPEYAGPLHKHIDDGERSPDLDW